MSNYTVKEHYVPQFIIKNFSDPHGLICFIDKQQQPLKVIRDKPQNILYLKNMYETKNEDGTFFNRNAIERKFAGVEGKLSLDLCRIINNVKSGKEISGCDDMFLAILVSLQLARTPNVKNILFNNNLPTFFPEDKSLFDNAMYIMAIDSIDSGIQYLKDNGLDVSELAKQKIGSQSLIDEIASYIVSSCDLYFIESEKFHFVISDNPILINEYDNALYIFPVTPQYAIVCSRLNNIYEHNSRSLRVIKDEMINKLNLLQIKNADRIVVFNEDDTEYVLKLLSTK